MPQALTTTTTDRRPRGRPSGRPTARSQRDGELVLRNLVMAVLTEGRVPRRTLTPTFISELTGIPRATICDARAAGLALIDFLDSASGDDAAA